MFLLTLSIVTAKIFESTAYYFQQFLCFFVIKFFLLLLCMWRTYSNDGRIITVSCFLFGWWWKMSKMSTSNQFWEFTNGYHGTGITNHFILVTNSFFFCFSYRLISIVNWMMMIDTKNKSIRTFLCIIFVQSCLNLNVYCWISFSRMKTIVSTRHGTISNVFSTPGYRYLKPLLMDFPCFVMDTKLPSKKIWVNFNWIFSVCPELLDFLEAKPI